MKKDSSLKKELNGKMKKKIIVYPTSANPPTWGHADLVFRAAKKFDLVYWVAATNPLKILHFTVQQRLSMMQDYLDYYQLNNVLIDNYEGVIVRYALSKGAQFLLRGLRNTSDFHQELELATGNRGINKEIETICYFAKPHYATISSSLIRQLALLNENIDQYVLPCVAEKIKKYLHHASITI